MSNTVKDILIYPIKSLAPISVAEGKVRRKGLKQDRKWMLVDQENKFISQRTYPQLTQIKVGLTETAITLSHNENKIEVPLREKNGNIYEVEIWDHTVEAYEVSEALNRWFSSILDSETKLVKMGKVSKREKKFLRAPWKSKVSFADGYPYLIIGTASLDLLNHKLKTPISIDRFRGNIIINTEKAHVEDNWETIIIGNAVFKMIKPCTRCKVITIDQQTGIASDEPISTLSSYRKFENKINFGMNAICIEKGEIRKGDSTILMKDSN
jgi:uncharacterized protein YcbX